MRRLFNGETLILALIVFMAVLAGCSGGSSDDPESGPQDKVEQTAGKETGPLDGIMACLEKLTVPGNRENAALMDRITQKLGKINIEDDAIVISLETELKSMVGRDFVKGSAESANGILERFESMLDELLLPDTDKKTEPVAVEGVDPETVRVLVSDGLTKKGASGEDQEILPYAVVYAVSKPEANDPLSFLLAKKVEGARVQFSYKNPGLGIFAKGHVMGDPMTTDSEGRAILKSQAAYLNYSCFPSTLDPEQKDILLKAEVLLPEKTVTDDNAFIRVLSTIESGNHDAILTDHDNTLHETGGSNTIGDIIDAAHVLKKEWPIMDACASGAVGEWIGKGNDLIIVSGLPHQLRGKAREQMALHFGDAPRRIPMILEKDTQYDDMQAFKKGIIATLVSLYGKSHIRAMVGDTASQDGYGAYHNGVKYAAYKINYKANPERLVIDGDVKVDKNQIAMDWKEVIEFIEGGDIAEKNFWLRNNEFLNIAHRGGGDLAPEDTLTAYRNAVAVGADAIEGDCHRTKDGVMVVSHDATIDRCTDGKGAIEDLTFAEIRSYDAGAKYTPDGGKTYPFKGKGIKIPTVEEVFVMLTTDLKGVPMILEIKTEKNREDAVKRVLDLIAKYDREGDLINRLQMGAFNQEALDYIYGEGEKRGMELVRCYSTEGVLKFLTTPLDDMLAPDYQSPGDVLALPWQLATSSVMNKAREANVNVNVWTVNDEFQMKWLRNVMHVDGIMTDNPALLEGLLK